MKVDVVGTGDNDGDVGIGDNQGDFVGAGENDGDAVGSGENDDVPNRNSDENIEEHVKKKVLKGKENSKINLKKQKRAAGREYLRRVYADGKYSVVEKGKGGSCGCTHKYMCKNFWDDDREAVFQKIWSISWQEKAVLVGSMTDRVIRKRRKTKDDDNDNVTKTCTFHYHLKRNGERRENFLGHHRLELRTKLTRRRKKTHISLRMKMVRGRGNLLQVTEKQIFLNF